jgi:septin family protein
MIVFGETGCGKSTFLNSIANYILGVELEDNYRYLIIAEDTRSQKGSITSVITDYYLKDKQTNTVYRLIDTPGFGDTRGYEKDEQIVEMVR